MTEEREHLNLQSIPNVKVEMEEYHARMSPCKFADLSREQINDLIAMKIMGWKKGDSFAFYGSEEDAKGAYWMNQGKQIAFRNPINNGFFRHFNPYDSLDDCWNAEEEILKSEKVLELYVHYTLRTSGMNREDLRMKHMTQVGTHAPLPFKPFTYTDILLWFYCAHATAPQKCEAMLRAIGEVE